MPLGFVEVFEVRADGRVDGQHEDAEVEDGADRVSVRTVSVEQADVAVFDMSDFLSVQLISISFAFDPLDETIFIESRITS